MSREYPWNYRVTIPQETVDRLGDESGWKSEKYPDFDALDALTYAVEECMTPCHYGIGVGGQLLHGADVVEYTFTANKTKAKVLKAKLDAFLGAEPSEFSKVDEQWWEDHKDE